MITREHDHFDSGVLAVADRLDHFRAGWVLQTGEADKDEVLFRISMILLGFYRPARERQDAQPLLRHGFLGFKDLLLLAVIQRTHRSINEPPRAQGDKHLGRPLSI